GWPRDKPAKLTDEQEKRLVAMLPKLPPASRGALVNLATRWGSKGLEKYSREIATSLLATARDESKPDQERASAARQLIESQKSGGGFAEALLGLITPRTSPALASGLIAAVARTDSAAVGDLLTNSLPSLTPAVRSEAIRALLGREDWVVAFLNGVDRGKVRLDELSLDQ